MPSFRYIQVKTIEEKSILAFCGFSSSPSSDYLGLEKLFYWIKERCVSLCFVCECLISVIGMFVESFVVRHVLIQPQLSFSMEKKLMN